MQVNYRGGYVVCLSRSSRVIFLEYVSYKNLTTGAVEENFKENCCYENFERLLLYREITAIPNFLSFAPTKELWNDYLSRF